MAVFTASQDISILVEDLVSALMFVGAAGLGQLLVAAEA
jgi:hypothetical protein